MSKNKDPAVLFYTSDFLSGVSDLTMKERGQYITLLCLQHQKGHLSNKVIKVNLGKVSEDVLAKFDLDGNGLYYNDRLDEEIKKRKQFVGCRQENGKKGGRPAKNEKPIGKPKKNLTENENENKNIYENNTDTVSFSFSTTTTTTPLSESACAQNEGDEYVNFTFEVMEYFEKNGFTSKAADFIAYNENRAWRGIGGEDVKAEFPKYADQWEEIQKMKNERFTR